MKRFAFVLRVAAAAALFCCAAIPAHATISYTVSLANRDQHRFHVTMIVPNATGQVIIRMAAWNALYQIRDFAYRVSSISAHDDSGPAAAVKLDKDTWSIAAHGTLTIQYDTDWNDSGPFACQLDTNHAFINPAMILMYVPERHDEDVSIAFTDGPANWHIAVELPDAPNGGGRAFTIRYRNVRPVSIPSGRKANSRGDFGARMEARSIDRHPYAHRKQRSRDDGRRSIPRISF
jgi:predicted metalloprotease with PDZ domain